MTWALQLLASFALAMFPPHLAAQTVSNGNVAAYSVCQQDGGTAICTRPIPGPWRGGWNSNRQCCGGVVDWNVGGPLSAMDSGISPANGLQAEIQWENANNCKGQQGNYCPGPVVQPLIRNFGYYTGGILGELHELGTIAYYAPNDCSNAQAGCTLFVDPNIPFYRPTPSYSIDLYRTIGCPPGYFPGGDWTQGSATPRNAWCWKSPVETPNDSCQKPGGGAIGKPASPADLIEHWHEVDVLPTSQSRLRFERWYSSGAFPYAYDAANPQPQLPMGAFWRSSYSQHLELHTTSAGPQSATVYLEDGGTQVFQASGSQWIPRSDEEGRLYSTAATPSGAGLAYHYFRGNGAIIDSFDSTGRLTAVLGTAGWRLQMTYSDSTTPASIAPGPGYLIKVIDDQGRQLQLVWSRFGHIAQLVAPDGGKTSLQYTHDENGAISAVTHADGTVTSYVYNELANFTANPVGLDAYLMLTSVYDEASKLHASIHYGSFVGSITLNGVDYLSSIFNEVSANAFAGGVGGATINTNNTNSYTPLSTLTYVDALGQPRTQSFGGQQGKVRSTGISAPDPAQPRLGKSLVFDGFANPASSLDFNDNLTRFQYDQNLAREIQRIEGLSSAGAATPVSRTTSTQWHATLPGVVAARSGPLVITRYDYNGDVGVSCAPPTATVPKGEASLPIGVLCARTDTATTDQTGVNRAGFAGGSIP